MTVARKQIGPAETYRGHIIVVRHMGPDLLCYVDGNQVGDFWLTAEAAGAGGRRYIDDIIENERTKRRAS